MNAKLSFGICSSFSGQASQASRANNHDGAAYTGAATQPLSLGAGRHHHASGSVRTSGFAATPEKHALSAALALQGQNYSKDELSDLREWITKYSNFCVN